MRNALDEAFLYYIQNQNELIKDYCGKYLVITEGSVVGAFNDREGALDFAAAGYKPGNFLIQLCTPGDSAYTRKYYTQRIRFNG